MRLYGKLGKGDICHCAIHCSAIKGSRGREKRAAQAEIQEQLDSMPANECDAGTCDECAQPVNRLTLGWVYVICGRHGYEGDAPCPACVLDPPRGTQAEVTDWDPETGVITVSSTGKRKRARTRKRR